MRQKTEKMKTGMILFTIILMIGTSFSFVLFGFGGTTGSVKENNIKFTSNGNMWLAKINKKVAAFSFLPSETSSINVTGQMPDWKGRIEIDTTSNPGDRNNQSIALAEHQMGLTLSNFNIFIRQGFTANNSYGMPVIKCRDSTSNVPVIMFRTSNKTQIKVEDCIIAEAATEADFIRIKDRLVYLILGVQNG